MTGGRRGTVLLVLALALPVAFPLGSAAPAPVPANGGAEEGQELAAAFRKAGLLPAGDAGSYLQRFGPATAGSRRPGPLPFANVVGLLPGSDRTMNTEVVVLAAPRPVRTGRLADSPPLRPDDPGNSTVSSLLDLARSLATRRAEQRRSLVVALFDAGEPGTTGSLHFVRHPPVPLDRIAAVVLLDRLDGGPNRGLQLHGAATSPIWKPLLKAAASPPGPLVALFDSLPPGSPADPFAEASRPTLLVTSGSRAASSPPPDTVPAGPSSTSPVDAILVPVLRSLLGAIPSALRPEPPASPAAPPRP